MTNEERDLITQFISRVGGRPAAASGFAGSVPAVSGPPLPPVDPEADALLADLFTHYPEARYRITQFAFVQEHAVAAAQNQITQLQTMVQQLQAQLQSQQAPAPAQGSPWGAAAAGAAAAAPPSRGLFGGLFGGGQPQQPQYAPQPQQYAPPPQYAPGYQPGMFQGSGTGFLGGALRTAAGVAGGVMAANALEGLFSGHHEQGYGGGFGGGGFGQQAGFAPVEASPWAAAPAVGGPDPYDQGGEAKSYPADTSWNATPTTPDTGWQDASSGTSDSGWSDASSSSDSSSDWTDSNS